MIWVPVQGTRQTHVFCPVLAARARIFASLPYAGAFSAQGSHSQEEPGMGRGALGGLTGHRAVLQEVRVQWTQPSANGWRDSNSQEGAALPPKADYSSVWVILKKGDHTRCFTRGHPRLSPSLLIKPPPFTSKIVPIWTINYMNPHWLPCLPTSEATALSTMYFFKGNEPKYI